ncbi:redox-sensing transcriptional repressor Rex [Oceanispirochaeta sp.]|jgi:redox-sensing transcriptional repressor|uniref:redox-sensing transcriptional repressor Rex n=1 Tax=Oceanispirochaeta sp. TaxID=2035350 RepID=UPI0026275B14|nr:redox-sensing transcriptional repressor Rex [Oceanispirochaeta sp.]MDA3957404.1 redox-sensing transcriptional repressor Rex [Oceanispirochaeta sp.]
MKSSNDYTTRLIKYKRILIQLKSLGLEKVFSSNLGDAIGITPSLVRKDLSRMNLNQGNRKGGYNINDMIESLNNILGTSELQDVVIIGCGNLGKALIKHEAFYKEGINITAGFDINPREAEINGIPIYSMEVLSNYVTQHEIRVAVLCVPAGAASHTRDLLLDCGIQGVLNFTPVELKSTDNQRIQNVNICLEIENLFFLISEKSQIMQGV